MKERYANRRPYGEWLSKNVLHMKDMLKSVPEAARKPLLLSGTALDPAPVPAPSTAGANGAPAKVKEEVGVQSLLLPLKVRQAWIVCFLCVWGGGL